MNKNEQLAWAAGFFDGEGCVSSGNRNYPVLQIGQVEDNVDRLIRFKEAIGGLGNYRQKWIPKEKKNWRPAKVLCITNTPDVVRAIELMWPWLSESKRQQIKEVLDKSPYKEGYNRDKTHCKRGHEFTKENTYINNRNDRKNPTRICKICNLGRQRASVLGITTEEYFEQNSV